MRLNVQKVKENDLRDIKKIDRFREKKKWEISRCLKNWVGYELYFFAFNKDGLN